MTVAESTFPVSYAPLHGNGHHVFVRGTSLAMRSLDQVIADIAPTDIPVLLVGESGTGKELVAAEIHRGSRRGAEPFVRICCANLTPETVNGHGRLPGHEGADGRGPFSGAGTLLLDEIGDLDPACQSKLLYALPGAGVLGADSSSDAGPRLICSTNHNLDEDMRAGRFREELYYRINGVCLRLPPLRQRREDIPALVDFFLSRYTALLGRPRPALDPFTLRLLHEHSWPGNIRELENAVRKMVALGDERAAVADLRSAFSEQRALPDSGEGISLKQAARAASRQAERQLILKVLTRTRWNRKRAAQELQISYKALLYKLKQIGRDDHVES